MSTDVEFSNEGIVAFEVASRPSLDYQGFESRIRYEFEKPVDRDQLAVVHAEVAKVAHDAARFELDQLIEEKLAHERGEAERQKAAAAQASKPQPKAKPAPAPAPEPEPEPASVPASDGPDWRQIGKPNGKGQLRYRPTSDLPTDDFKELIRQAIAAKGADPDGHQIFDERIGKYGLESGNKRYSAATVKPAEDNPVHGDLVGTGRNGQPIVKASFWVDFTDDGGVSVKATNDYVEAAKAHAAGHPAQQEEEQLPF